MVLWKFIFMTSAVVSDRKILFDIFELVWFFGSLYSRHSDYCLRQEDIICVGLRCCDSLKPYRASASYHISSQTERYLCDILRDTGPKRFGVHLLVEARVPPVKPLADEVVHRPVWSLR